jgi:hypothetical protein
MTLTAADLARLASLCGPSNTFWSLVYACTVVMKARSIPKASCSTFTIGATQLVVQEALEMTKCLSGR